MTNAQKKAIKYLRREVTRLHSYGEDTKYEFKKFEVEEFTWAVSVVTEFGMVDDEGTMAAHLCRDYRHFFIGKRGGIKLMNGKKKNISGAAAFYSLTR